MVFLQYCQLFRLKHWWVSWRGKMNRLSEIKLVPIRWIKIRWNECAIKQGLCQQPIMKELILSLVQKPCPYVFLGLGKVIELLENKSLIKVFKSALALLNDLLNHRLEYSLQAIFVHNVCFRSSWRYYPIPFVFDDSVSIPMSLAFSIDRMAMFKRLPKKCGLSIQHVVHQLEPAKWKSFCTRNL